MSYQLTEQDVKGQNLIVKFYCEDVVVLMASLSFVVIIELLMSTEILLK